ncbi:MAG TPA: glycosyl hydrolase family 28-related protein [Opitutaceae bacterium]|nr:glycosyl hydrolase family 28-related protein [Opitutaceae bacterium]
MTRILGLVATFAFSTGLALAQSHTFNVRDYGATGDGKTIDSPAINKAIDAAAAAGGGTVYFPAGTYASYSIHLKSHLVLRLDAGATILAAEPPADLSTGYDAPEPNPGADQYEDFGHAHWHNSLIWGENLEDVSIIGPGLIFGRGLSRGGGRRDLLPAERKLPKEQRPDVSLPKNSAATGEKRGPFGYPGRDVLPAGVGNKSIALKNCHNVTFRDFSIFHGGHFGILVTGVDNLTMDNLKIDTNRDGMDIDCCQNVRVSNCSVNSPFDDGICPKSSYALGYARPVRDLTITNCMVSGYDEGTMLDGTCQRTVKYGHGPNGRIKCGTESNGGFINVTISNCVVEYSRGIAFESVDGAIMEDITVSNIAMRDIVDTPLYIRLGSRLRGPEGTVIGTARRIKINNVVVHNSTVEGGIIIAGDPLAPVEDVSLSDIFVDYEGGGTAQDAGRPVPEYEGDGRYPEPFRLGRLSAWGLFARHVKGLEVHDVEFRAGQPDLRPAVWLEDVAGADFEHDRLPHAAGTPVFALKNVSDFTVHNSPGVADARRDKAADEKL